MMTFKFSKLVSALSSDSQAPVKVVDSFVGPYQPTGSVVFPCIQVNGAPSLLEPPANDCPRREVSAREARLGALVREQFLEIQALQREISRLRSLTHHTTSPPVVPALVPSTSPPAYPSMSNRIAAQAPPCIHKPTIPTPAIRALATSPASQSPGGAQGSHKASVMFGPRPCPPRTRSAPTPVQQSTRPSNLQSCVRAHPPVGSPSVNSAGVPKVVRFATEVQTV
jgi:hypothetical protein